MTPFTLRLLDATHTEQMDDVVSFVGEDASGQFGIQAGHEPLMTMLEFGLARFRREEGPWEFVGLPGGLLYMDGGRLHLCTSHYLRDSRRERLVEMLEANLHRDRTRLEEFSASLRRLEEQMLRRLWRMTGGGI